ncbi:hypothetical protein ACFJIU_06575 [Mesorhizobium sp. UC74_2]|uniref:hypothetical protein n=2 Tax=Mesorhizobium TaxID=68287 RepID=UPI0036720EB6
MEEASQESNRPPTRFLQHPFGASSRCFQNSSKKRVAAQRRFAELAPAMSWQERAMEAFSPTVEQTALQRRRFLALRRKERDEHRLNLLDACITDYEKAARIREWVEWVSPTLQGEPDVAHLVEWAKRNAAQLEAKSAAAMSQMGLRELFPEVDDLHDPLGDPAPKHPWGL